MDIGRSAGNQVFNADRILVLSEGRLILEGPPREICRRMDVLERVGIRVPQVTEFMISFLSRLNRSPQSERIPLTVEEAAGMLREILHEGVVA